jgi:hypothetical protein
MAECTKRELYNDLRAITEHQKSKFLVYSDSSCIVITRSRELARVITVLPIIRISMTFIGLVHALLNYVNYAYYINQKQPHLVRFEVNSSKETRSNYKFDYIV